MIEGRIIKGVGGLYWVSTKQGLFECNVRGLFRKKNITPTIGDIVNIDIINKIKNKGNIIEIKERKNLLIRPKVSNIDQAIIVFSICNPDINIDLLDKFLIMIEEKNITPLICINKVDLVPEENYLHLKEVYENIGYNVVCVSALTNTELDSINDYIYNKTSVFAGPSGVGKSSLINKIIPNANMETGELSSKIQRGKHTTRHTELIEAFEDSFIVDTPGFTTLYLDGVTKDNLKNFFIEFNNYSHDCRFSNCMHINEPDCSVKNQVGKNIYPERYERYLKIFVEL